MAGLYQMAARRAWTIAGMVGIALALLFGLWLSVPDDPGTSRPRDPAVASVTDKPRATRPPPPPTTATPTTTARWEPRPPEAETVDPCTAMHDPDIPEGFDTLAVGGITVAWSRDASERRPYERPLQPALLAHATTALLEEAAELTNTPARSQLTVIVWPSDDLFRSRTKAPSWAGGLYDGGVELPVDHFSDFGVAYATLRHEVMHAQLHYAVGCMPVWFNEGSAELFAGETPMHAWTGALREHAWFDTRSLAVPSITAVHTDKTSLVYAESLAMVIAALDKQSMPDLIVAMRYDAPRERLDLWDRHYRDLDAQTLLDALGHRLFGLPLGGDLDALLAGPMCCTSLTSPRDVRCHATTKPEKERSYWTDRASSPMGACSSRW